MIDVPRGTSLNLIGIIGAWDWGDLGRSRGEWGKGCCRNRARGAGNLEPCCRWLCRVE